MSEKWIVSDTHFGHRNIIKFRTNADVLIRPRPNSVIPFDDIQEHDELLIKNWNSVIGQYDKVYHVGDFGNIKVIRRLNGKKRLFLGNHDHISDDPEWMNAFEDIRVSRQFKKEFTRPVIFTHHPIHREDNGNFPRLVNVHGHIHEKTIMDYSICKPDPWYINVCIEHLPEYTPVNFDYINTKLRLVP